MSDIDKAMRLMDREIWLVTAEHEGRRGGLIATFVNSASIVPDLPRMLVGIARQHHTHTLIEASRAFTLHLLDEGHLEWVWRFGLEAGHAVDKFAGMGALDAIAWLSCQVEASLDTGDRSVYLAAVSAGKLQKETPPLTMKRLVQLAPPERLQQLRAGLERDAAIDAAAIRAWRLRA
jgi:flavin reductase (DIM6/NTAB) family NADH-FMN oxidoreductase RutF